MHILDPFTGTGLFLVRLLQSELIRDEDLTRKYRQELHANELVLLAYYISAIHIEEAYHGRMGLNHSYAPFEGIVLTDTFNLHTGRSGFPRDWLPENSQRAERQQNAPIQVIVGNPPWSAHQKSSADENPNVNYPKLEQRVRETYAEYSKTSNKTGLYDSYKMAIRWASDRIGEEGIVAFVTNGSWIDGNTDAGVRACLAEEFTSVHVVNLRGNARTSGERRRSEGDNIFGQGSRTPAAITVLVRNPNARHEGCRIRYRDIGDYHSRKKKLDTLKQWGSITLIRDWKDITPDQHHDWIGHRDGAFQQFYPMGSKEAKALKTDRTIFRLYCNGYKTGRDAYSYSFSYNACIVHAKAMVRDYLDAFEELQNSRNTTTTIEDIVRRHSSNLRWDREVKNNLKRCRLISYAGDKIWSVQYRPYVKQHCYVEYLLASNKYKWDSFFPTSGTHNRTICVPGIGSNNPFSVLITDSMPDHGLAAQCFPRYHYEVTDQKRLPSPIFSIDRMDNITDAALNTFQTHYGDHAITKDHLFDYVYGLLHAPSYVRRFANDLSKGLPRIPFAPDFHAFARAGRELADLHLGYEQGPEYSLEIKCSGLGEPQPDDFRIGRSKMCFDEDGTVLKINDRVRLTGIPPSAHEYQVNGRSPLEWFIDRYRVTQDTQSGIVNDPNGWFRDPRDLVAAIRRIVHVSVETRRIVDNLPEPFAEQLFDPVPRPARKGDPPDTTTDQDG